MQSLTPRGKLINAMFYMSQHLAHCSYTNTVRLLKQQCGMSLWYIWYFSILKLSQ